MKKLPEIYKNNNIKNDNNKNISNNINDILNIIIEKLRKKEKVIVSIETIKFTGTFTVLAVTLNNLITVEGEIIKINDIKNIILVLQ